jgi:hypothetical protein
MLSFREPVGLGQSASAAFEVGSLRGAAGGSTVEAWVAELPPAARAAGWSLDTGVMPGKPFNVLPGERKQVVVRFSAPKEPPADSALLLGLGEWVEVPVGVILRGGTPGTGPDGPLRYCVTARCLLLPPAPAGAEEGASP